jgi:hypothetical protein
VSPVLRDIRELKDDPAAYAAELRRLWGGLLVTRLSISSPEGNVGSDLVAVPNPVTGGTNER